MDRIHSFQQHGPSSRALTGIGIFLFFGAAMASLAGITLLWRGTVLERMWTVNPGAYKHLVPFVAAEAYSAPLVTSSGSEI
jgi:hypothetical protein